MIDPLEARALVDPWALSQALKGAGFSSRTAHALAYGSVATSLADLKSRPWGSREEQDGLMWDLRCLPNLGPKGMAEVVAFRAGLDPRSAKAPGAERVSVPFKPEELASLDAWIAKQPSKTNRPEAIRILTAAALQKTSEVEHE